MDKKKTFWPYGILLCLVGCVVACIWTIIVCLDYPVYEDNAKFAKYQEVDYNINEIEEAQSAFETAFGASEFVLYSGANKANETMKMRKKRVVKVANASDEIRILLKTGANSGKIDAFLTRPETNEFDTKLNAQFCENGVCINDIKVPKNGRCQGGSVTHDGKYWNATCTYTHSGDARGWDRDLYGEDD